MRRFACLALTILAACAVDAEDAPPPPSRVGALVFFASLDRTTLPLPIGELRTDVQARIDDALAATGTAVVPSREIVARAGMARVRSAAVLPPAFLNELRTEAGLDNLALVEVVIASDRVILLARALNTVDGCVSDVWLAEALLAPVVPEGDVAVPAAALLAALDGVCRKLTTPVASRAQGRPVLVLPTIPVGCSPEEALVATYALLHQVRIVADCNVFDPAVAKGVLMAEGHDPDRLDAAGRALLATRFGTVSVLHPSLVSFDDAGSPTAVSRAVDDGGSPRPKPMLASYLFTLIAVTLQDGRLVAAAEHQHQEAAATGLFGRPRRVSQLEDLVASAASAWASLQSSRGDL